MHKMLASFITTLATCCIELLNGRGNKKTISSRHSSFLPVYNPIILVRCKYFYIQTSQVSLRGISSPRPAGLGPALWIRTWISLSALCSLRLVICLTATSREPDIYCMKLDVRKAKIVNPYPRSGFDIFLYKNIIFPFVSWKLKVL